MRITNYLILLTIYIGFNCTSFPTYEATVLESYDISDSVNNAGGLASDISNFYILNLSLGTYDDTNGVQSYNYVKLNIFNKDNLALFQSIDLTTLLNLLDQSVFLQRCQYQYNNTGPLIYFDEIILFIGIYGDNCKDNKGYQYKVIEYNISSNIIRFIDGLPRGYSGYNPDKSLVWINIYPDNYLNEYFYNTTTKAFDMVETEKFMGTDTIVYVDNNGIWTFLAGYTIIEGGRQVPDTIAQYPTVDSKQPLFKSEIPLNYSCLPQIIPEGDIVWAVCEDKNDGKYYILKLDPFGGQPPPGCDSQAQAFSLPSYFQNFGLLAVALGYFGFRRKKKRL